ncbi:MAG TPA: hypothetical protein VN875_11515 [Candidatus Binatus sp.]|jgi:hypothetical protein|nr:hypothetical protein [Candidatus Binatus sp.]
MDQEHAAARRSGVTTLLFTVLLVSPCFFAWACSWVISQGGPNSHSGMWFIYQVAQYLSYLGLVVALVLTIINAKEGAISRIIVFLMALSITSGISALWYAVHIYRSPWY